MKYLYTILKEFFNEEELFVAKRLIREVVRDRYNNLCVKYRMCPKCGGDLKISSRGVGFSTYQCEECKLEIEK
jgi:hypothetical protein